MAELIIRLEKRLPGVDQDNLTEYLRTVSDRLCLRLGEIVLPSAFESICIDACVKMHRRVYYEGISGESVANMTTSFVDDILSEYASEIGGYKEQQLKTGASGPTVRFL